MERHLIDLNPADIPSQFHPFLEDSTVYDSSCSRAARVYYIQKASGLFLKKAPKGTLKKEADLYGYFHKKGLAPEVLAYESLENDWLLTREGFGQDCISPLYLSDPERLCDTTAQLLRMLHDTDFAGCPVPNRTFDYLTTAEENYRLQKYDLALFPDNWGYASADEARKELESNGKFLKADTLLHGDYCLPNILLNNWQFGCFIDLGAGGVGDRHIDLFWGMWSLQFNLKTDRFKDRFLDVYGRDQINTDCFRTVAAAEVFG